MRTKRILWVLAAFALISVLYAQKGGRHKPAPEPGTDRGEQARQRGMLRVLSR